MERTFEAAPSAVHEARQFVAVTLADLGVRAEDRDLAQLCTSELATNAVAHAGTKFSVCVEPDANTVRISVTDGGRGVPEVQAPTDDRPGGRGLVIVSSLAMDWGVSTDQGRKTVWCMLVASPA